MNGDMIDNGMDTQIGIGGTRAAEIRGFVTNNRYFGTALTSSPILWCVTVVWDKNHVFK